MGTLLLIIGFEGYWLNKLYNDEVASLRREVDVSFRETMYQLQKQRFEKDSALFSDLIVKHSAPKQDTIGFRKAALTLPSPSVITDSTTTITINSRDVRMMMGEWRRMQQKSDTTGKPNIFLGGAPPILMEVIAKKIQPTDSGFVLIHKNDSTGKTNKYIIKTNPGFFPFTQKSSTKPARNKKNLAHKDSSIFYANNVEASGSIDNRFFKFLFNSKILNDSIPATLVDSAYTAELKRTKKELNFTIHYRMCKPEEAQILRERRRGNDSLKGKQLITNEVLIGFNTPYAYQAKFKNATPYVLKKMQLQIGGSALLLALIVFAFTTLYRNLVAQHKLAEIKNEFISNITHELKTPISTVNVAIEALQNFDVTQNTERTKEYLAISATELQRLSMLVDKVLKLSMFERHETTVTKEFINLLQLVTEVTNSMGLQFQKLGAQVHIQPPTQPITLWADKLHLTSVLYNLLDNALKYSRQTPSIHIVLSEESNWIVLQVTDNGIGIPPAYTHKIFEKFFRVPTNNKHNVKGYGLGLSYVAHIVAMHHGVINVESEEEKGTTFTIKLPIT
jgi:two-component system, OmpR family, phosphate regulon sensor histidine kinase PhoR